MGYNEYQIAGIIGNPIFLGVLILVSGVAGLYYFTDVFDKDVVVEPQCVLNPGPECFSEEVDEGKIFGDKIRCDVVLVSNTYGVSVDAGRTICKTVSTCPTREIFGIERDIQYWEQYQPAGENKYRGDIKIRSSSDVIKTETMEGAITKSERKTYNLISAGNERSYKLEMCMPNKSMHEVYVINDPAQEGIASSENRLSVVGNV